MCTGVMAKAWRDRQNSSHHAFVAARVPAGAGGMSGFDGETAAISRCRWRWGRLSTRVPGRLRGAGISGTGPSWSCTHGTGRL